MHTQSHTMALHTFLPPDNMMLRQYRLMYARIAGENRIDVTHVFVALNLEMGFSVCLLVAAVIGLTLAEPPVSLNKESFAKTVGAGSPVFVKFFAPW